MAILNLSKTLMYEYHYNYINKRYGGQARLLFTHMYSLAYEIQTEDFYRDLSPDVKEKFDTSNFEEKHISGIPTGLTKKISGLIKDEVRGKIIEKFVGLRSKLYSYKANEGKLKKRKCVKESRKM